MKAEPALLDAVSQAAAATRRSLNGYVVHAMEQQLKRDGFEVPPSPAAAPSPAEPEPARPKRRVGRPKKGG